MIGTTNQTTRRSFWAVFLVVFTGYLTACGNQPTAEHTATPSHDLEQSAVAPSALSTMIADQATQAKAEDDQSENSDEVSALVAPLASSSATAPATSRSVSSRNISLSPQDDCAALSGWSAFHERLQKAVRAKDADAFIALTSPDIRLDYGGGSGRAELAKRLAEPKRALWRELEDILPLGCATDNGLTVMPWFFWNVPDDIDPYTALITTGPDVPLLARPASDAKMLKSLNWALVVIKGPFNPADTFTKVTADEDASGYVRTSQLRSLLDYRLIAENRAGEWRITAFIAGD